MFLISESVIFAIITGIIAAKYRPMDDITDIMPVLSFIEVKMSDIVGSKTIEPPELTNENQRGKTVFIGKPPWQAYVLKDWLAIRRIRALRRQIYLAPFVVITLTIAILFIFVAGLSVIIGKTKWGSFKTRVILLLGIVFLATPLFLLI